jgi:phenylacetate-coenzyme A ligase PaaK-like adenylate-forming protein
MPAAPYLQRVANARAALSRERELRGRDAWTPEQLSAHQGERLGALVRHAVAHSPLYRERLAGVDTSGPVDLSSLPPVRKDELMERFDDWVCDRRLHREEVERHLAGLDGDELYLDRFRVMATGGTTGRRGLFVFDRAEWTELCALMLRGLRAHGVTPKLPRRRIATVLAPSAAHMTWRISASMDFGLHRNLRLSVTQPMDELVRELNAFRPDNLAAYPSMAALLAEEQLAGRLKITPAFVSTSSEVCTPEMRERMREAWGIEPHEVYGATDGLWGFTCERQAGVHFAEDATIVEVEDERLLITNLFMRTQPIIRYEVTDLVRLAGEPCACGRPSRLVAAIEGRSDDILRLPGGVVLHPIHLRSPMARLPGVRQYQIVHRADGLHVRVVPRAADVHRAVHEAMSGALARAGAGGVPVHVELVEAIERDPTGVGKLKLVRSEAGQPVAATVR